VNFSNVIVASILTFAGCFITIRSCNAAEVQQSTTAPATAQQKEEAAEKSVDLGLIAKAKDAIAAQQKVRAAATTLSEKILATKRIRNLQEVIDLLQAEGETEPAEPSAVSYVDVANEFRTLVPVYSGNETPEPIGFGTALRDGLFLADNEKGDIKIVKTAVVNRLQEAHTRAVLDQDTLHIPEYTALLNAAPRNEAVLEVIQQERLADEARIEELANPSFWQTLKWWWNS